MYECVYICLNGCYFTFTHCKILSAWTRGCLFQRLHESESRNLNEHETAFLKRQDLSFFREVFDLFFCLRLNIFISKILNMLLPLGIGSRVPCILIYSFLSLHGLTSGVLRIRTYAYFYWPMYDFGHAYVDTYARFSRMIFLKFSNFCCFLQFYAV